MGKARKIGEDGIVCLCKVIVLDTPSADVGPKLCCVSVWRWSLSAPPLSLPPSLQTYFLFTYIIDDTSY